MSARQIRGTQVGSWSGRGDVPTAVTPPPAHPPLRSDRCPARECCARGPVSPAVRISQARPSTCCTGCRQPRERRGLIRSDGPEMPASTCKGSVSVLCAGSAYRVRLAVAEPLRRELQLARPRELLAVELFFCAAEAKVLIEDGRQDYNHHHPHSALGMVCPTAFAAVLRQPSKNPRRKQLGKGRAALAAGQT